MDQQQFKVSQLGRRTGLNPGTISSILNGHKLIAVDQLDRVTSVMGLEEGYFYSQYIQESMVDAPPNWRRLKPLLFRCAELNRLDCTQRIVNLLLDNLTYSPLLFETAEELRDLGELAAAALLYEGVALSERSQHSERLALCQYRLFTLRLGEDQAKNLEAAIHFEPYVERLDEMEQLDALRDLANAYRSLRKWDKVANIAHTMGKKANIMYELLHNTELRRKEEPVRTQKPLFYYRAFADLLMSNVSAEKKDYQQALHYTHLYEDLSWVNETDSETLHWKGRFFGWAEVNKYVIGLLAGDQSVLPSYVDYIFTNEGEVLPGILNMIQAANNSGLNINNYLEKFQNALEEIINNNKHKGVYTQQYIDERLTKVLYEFAYYFLNYKVYSKGFDYLLKSLEKSLIINNEQSILNCMRLFERFRQVASCNVSRDYHILVTKE